MADTRKVLKIFLASPGDLSDERRAAKAVVDEINGLFANAFGYHVELVGWEDTISGFGRPQAIINAELDHCEFFIGLMWRRWGTPPDHSGPYTSGFEEEFERSIERRKKEDRPEISVFFKEINADFLRDPGEELKKVMTFKQNLIDGKDVYFENFSDIRDLETKIRRCVSRYVVKLQSEEAAEVASRSQTQPTGGNAQRSVQTAVATSESPFSAEGVKFLRYFISKSETNFDNDPIKIAEVARFRLLSDIVGGEGNDRHLLGVHDANSLFDYRKIFVFGDPELMGLMGSGLEHYSDENVPFWHWYSESDGIARKLLPMFSVIGGTERRRAGALSAMRLVSEPLPSEPPLGRTVFLDRWLAQDEARAVKVSALSYLGEAGVPEDIEAIKGELARNDYQTKTAAVETIIRISLRESREKAIMALYELQPATVDGNLLAAVFEQRASLSTETLLAGITHQGSEVRRLVVSLLRTRHALEEETAERLLNDESAPVRLEALKALVEGGRTFSQPQLKDILVKPSANRGIGLFGSSSDSMGEACLEQLQQEHLKTLVVKELEDLVREQSIFNQNARFILAERQFEKYGEELRRAIDDQFVSDFAVSLKERRERYGEIGTDLFDQITSLENFVRKQLTRSALDVICRKSNREDLGLVRKALSSDFVDYSSMGITYLGKFGEWEDVPLIVTAADRQDPRQNTLLSFGQTTRKYREASRAIYKIGRDRFFELLAIPKLERLLPYLIAQASDSVYRSLIDAAIIRLLRSDQDVVRKAASLKCVRALPKKRLAKILESYMAPGEHRYYNVIHWLDFGLSGPREKVLRAIDKTIKKEWLE